MSDGSRDEPGTGVWGSVHGKGYFWGRIWATPLWPMGTLRRTCSGPLPKLLWVDLISCGHRSLLWLLWVCVQGFIQTLLVWGKIASIPDADDGVWGCAPSGVQGQSPWWGGLGRSPQKLEAFCCVSSWFLYVQCTGSYRGRTASLLYVCNDDRNCMNCTYTLNHKKVAEHLCHNIGKSRSIFRIFALSKKKFFKRVWKMPASPNYRA